MRLFKLDILEFRLVYILQYGDRIVVEHVLLNYKYISKEWMIGIVLKEIYLKLI